MSGICGIFNLDGQPVERPLLDKMTAFLEFRGPDARGIWSEGPIGLGQTLLQTTEDTACEGQPATLGELAIAADARIDGREELLEKLRDFGLPQNISDVKLILYAYRRWGENCLEHLLGDFAFALWDSRKQQLFCARDPVGAKLLYWARVGNSAVFSNTLNCLRLHPKLSHRLNEQAIADFLLFGLNCDDETTTFAEIACLPGGCQLNVTAEGIQQRRYWTLPLPPQIRYRRTEDYIAHFREVLDRAVSDRLRAKNVSISFSGGLDSTNIAVAALEAAQKRGNAIDLRAFTLVYDCLIPDSERHFSGIAARALNIPIHYTVADDCQLFQGGELPELQRPEPLHAPLALIALHQLRALAAHSRVVLNGQGGDEALRIATVREMLQGMPLPHVAIDLARCWFQYRLKPPLGTGLFAAVRWASARVQPGEDFFPVWFAPEFAQRQNLRERWQEIWNRPLPLDRPPRSLAYHGLPPNALWHLQFSLGDPGVSGFPVEMRSPFADLRLMNYLLALPPLPWCLRKTLLRETLRSKLPESICQRPKSPLAVEPVKVKLSAADAGQFEDSFCPALETYVDRGLWRQAMADCARWPKQQNLHPVSLGYWLQRY